MKRKLALQESRLSVSTKWLPQHFAFADLCFWTKPCCSKKILPEWKTKVHNHHSEVISEWRSKVTPFQWTIKKPDLRLSRCYSWNKTTLQWALAMFFFSFLYLFLLVIPNILHPTNSIHFLYTCLYKYLLVLTRRIPLTFFKASKVGDHFLFSPDLNDWSSSINCKEKLNAGHS